VNFRAAVVIELACDLIGTVPTSSVADFQIQIIEDRIICPL